MALKSLNCLDFLKNKLSISRRLKRGVTARSNGRPASVDKTPGTAALEDHHADRSAPVCPGMWAEHGTDPLGADPGISQPPLPDMETILTRNLNDVKQLKHSMAFAKNRIAGTHEAMLQGFHLRGVYDFSDSGLKPADTHSKNAIMLLLLENVLKYRVYFRHVTQNELLWAGGDGRSRQRIPTFEKETAALEKDFEKTVCGIKIHAAECGVELPLGFMHDEIDSIVYTKPEPVLKADASAYVIYNSYETDFVPFAVSFFSHHS